MKLSHFNGYSYLGLQNWRDGNLISNNNDDEIDHPLEIISSLSSAFGDSANLHGLKYRVVDVSSMVNAKLTFNITCIKDIQFLLDDDEDSCHVNGFVPPNF